MRETTVHQRSDTTTELAEFFDRFVTAFASFDGVIVAGLFTAPGVALKQDGSLKGFAAIADIAAYYQTALDQYRAAGCQSCRYGQLETHALGTTSTVATVTWDLVQADNSLVAHWRQAYFLTKIDGAWRCFGSAFVTD